MAFEAFGSVLIAEGLLEDGFGTLSRAWERDPKGGIRPIFVRRFAPQLCVPLVVNALQRSMSTLDLPSTCGSGHQFALHPSPHWKLNYQKGHSIRRIQEKCREEGFPFGLSQALLVAWNLAHVCARFWRQGLSVGPLNTDSVRVDFEGSLFLPELGWQPVVIGVADHDASLRAALPELPRGPVDGNLEEEARRFGAFLYELLTFAPPPSGSRLAEALETAMVWTPDEPEPLPLQVREGLARLLDDQNPFGTLEGALKDLEALVFDEDEGPSTFNLAHLIHTLFRREHDRQVQTLAAEQEALKSSELWGGAAGPVQPASPVQGKSHRGLILGGTLGLAAAASVLLLLIRDQDHSRRLLEAELAKLQTAYAVQVQQGVDAASLERHQEKLKEELQRLAASARTAEERTLVGNEIERLAAKVPPAQTRVNLSPSALPSSRTVEGPVTEVRTIPVSARLEPPASPPLAAPAVSSAPGSQAQAPPPAGVASSRPQDGPPQIQSLPRLAWPQGTPRVRVSMRAFIHEDGRPLRATAVPGSSAPAELVQAATEAVMKSRFLPAMRNGKPIRDWVQVDFNP